MQFDDFLSVIDLLKDTTKYEAKVTELKAREQAIQDSITQLGIVGDIKKANEKATSLLSKAEEVVSKATQQAEQIVAAALVAYNKRHADLQKREVIADQALADYNTMKNSFAVRSDELRKAEKEIEQAKQQLEADRADLAAKQAEVEVRLAKLREAMG